MVRSVPESERQRLLAADIRVLIGAEWIGAAEVAHHLRPPVFVISAADPDGSVLTPEQNRMRNGDLRVELEEAGATVFEATIDSERRMQTTEGWAAVGPGRRRMRSSGRDAGQDAIFEIAEDWLRVLGCQTTWARSRRFDEVAGDPDGETLEYAVLGALGIVVEPDFLRAFETGWSHDGDLDVPCPECGGRLHLFGADLQSKSGTRYRSMAFVCADEASVRLPNLVPPSYRQLAKALRAWLLARQDADEAGLIERTHWAYVIELSDDVGFRSPGSRGWVYVGETATTPERRFEQHRSGYKASRWVRTYGVRLRPDLYLEQPMLRTKAESQAYEVWLFALLAASGYDAKGGH